MNTKPLFKFRGVRTTEWVSDRTGRKMVTRGRSYRFTVAADNSADAIAAFADHLETTTTTAQRRTVGFHGTATVIGHRPGRRFAEIIGHIRVGFGPTV